MGAYEIVQQLETMRKKKVMYTKLVVACAFSPMLLMFFAPMLGLVELTPFLCMGIFFFGVLYFSSKSGKITKEYKRLYKENFVVSVLNEVFDNVTYKYMDGFDQRYVKQFGLTRLGNRFRSEDYIRASYKGINFEQADVVIKYHSSGKNSHTTTYFKGRMFVFDFPFKRVQSVQVFSEGYPYRATPVGNARMNKIEMESELFNKEFDVRSLDSMDAFYVLTPQMMEKIQIIRSQYNHVAMNFCGNKLYMGIWTSGNAFDGDDRRKVNFVEEKEATLRDASVITGIIDALGMMKPEGFEDSTPSKTNDDYMVGSSDDELANMLRENGLSDKDVDKLMSVGRGLNEVFSDL